MSLININGNQDDLFYRYKMPPIQSKIEGKGNGIKTVIPNMTEVAKALGRPPMYPCKYFGTELGAQTKHEPKNDRYIVNGAHDAQRLQELLDGFIQKFVLCTYCRNPETSLRITEDGNIFRDCQACGQHSSIDMRHKLVNYILNHPPPGAIAAGSTIKKQSKKKGKGKNKDQSSSSIPEDEQPDEAGDAFLAKITEEAKTLAKPASKEDDWSVDLSKEAQLRRQAELTQGIDQLNLHDAATPSSSSLSSSRSKKGKKKKSSVEEEDDFGFDESNESDPLDLLAKFTQSLDMVSSDTLIKEIRRLEIPYHYAVHVITQVLVSPTQLTSDLKKHRSVFQGLLSTSSKAPLYFLGGIEVVVAKHDLHKKLPVILKVIYDMDLVDESEILKWGEKPTRKFTGKLRTSTVVHEAAEPFLKWLREAEEEDEDDEDDDEEGEEEEDDDE